MRNKVSSGRFPRKPLRHRAAQNISTQKLVSHIRKKVNESELALVFPLVVVLRFDDFLD